MGNSQSKQEKAPLEQFDVILQLLAKRGVLPDTKVTDDARRAAMQKRLRDSYHNTELLLKNYRTIAWMLECFPEALAEELDRPFETVDQLLDGIDIASTFGERKLEHRTAAVEQTRLLMERINDALTVLKRRPENGQLMYDLIYQAYLAPEKLTGDELRYRLALSTRHFYRIRKEAITILSLRLWSTPDSASSLWIELLELLEEKGKRPKKI